MNLHVANSLKNNLPVPNEKLGSHLNKTDQACQHQQKINSRQYPA